MGQLWSFGDTLRLTAGLYDAARGGGPLREVTTRVPANGAIGAAFNALADSLLGAEPGAARGAGAEQTHSRSEEHTSELQSQSNLVCRLLLENKNNKHLAITMQCIDS